MNCAACSKMWFTILLTLKYTPFQNICLLNSLHTYGKKIYIYIKDLPTISNEGFSKIPFYFVPVQLFICVHAFHVCMCDYAWSDAYSSVHCRFWQARGEKEDGETELGQRVAELPTASVRVLNVWGGTGGPWANSDIASSACSRLARQHHVNITSSPHTCTCTHKNELWVLHIVSLRKTFNHCDVVVD